MGLLEEATDTPPELVVPAAAPPSTAAPCPCRERGAHRVPRHPRHAGAQGGVCPGDHQERGAAPAGAALPGQGGGQHAPPAGHCPRIPRLPHQEQLQVGKHQKNVARGAVSVPGHLGPGVRDLGVNLATQVPFSLPPEAPCADAPWQSKTGRTKHVTHNMKMSFFFKRTLATGSLQPRGTSEKLLLILQNLFPH